MGPRGEALRHLPARRVHPDVNVTRALRGQAAGGPALRELELRVGRPRHPARPTPAALLQGPLRSQCSQLRCHCSRTALGESEKHTYF